MSKLSFEEIIRHKIIHPFVEAELGTNFLVDLYRNCSVNRGKVDILEKQLQFCHNLCVMPLCQQSCAHLIAQTQQELACDAEISPLKQIKQKSRRGPMKWDEMACQRLAWQTWGEILIHWMSKQRFVQQASSFPFSFWVYSSGNIFRGWLLLLRTCQLNQEGSSVRFAFSEVAVSCTECQFASHKRGTQSPAGAVQKHDLLQATSRSLAGLTASSTSALSLLHNHRLPSMRRLFWNEMESWVLGRKKNHAIPTLSSLSPALTESWVSVVFVSASFSLAKEIIVTNSSSYVFSGVSEIRSFSWKQK